MKFVDIKNDVAFRKIFGNENKKEILISFLNAVLELTKGKLIRKVEIKNPFQLPEIKDLKSSILDIRATDERNISYIVEMQVEEPDGFDKRVQYYTAKQYSAQIDIGDDYPKLNQVIFIGILNFDFFDGTNYLTRHLIINQKTGKQELKDLEFNFIELLKFNIPLCELNTLIEKWTYFLKNAPNLDIIPENIDDEGLRYAYENAAQHNWTKEELLAYDYAGMRRQDEKGKLILAEKKGHEKEKIEIAKEMIFDNEPIEKIMKFTKLDKETIMKLINQMNDK
ncbi:MAG: Rpn family recombination-promoting nuclease/putative transposase [Bacteroidia bacterium]|nr:Rpn family recombination-promoting nuclease/putative transposase [Bacteroidia bacterium]